MFRRLKKQVITPEQIERKVEAEQLQREAKKELVEAQELASILRTIRIRNHFAESFRKSLGETSGH